MRVCVCREPAVLTAKPRQTSLGKAPGSSLTVVYPERARRKPKAQSSSKNTNTKKATTEIKTEKKLTLSRVLVKSSMLTVTVPSLALLLSPLGAMLGLRV